LLPLLARDELVMVLLRAMDDGDDLVPVCLLDDAACSLPCYMTILLAEPCRGWF
jgi:hypothetical protein